MTRRAFVYAAGAAAAAAPLGAQQVPRPAGEFVIRLPNREQMLLSSFKGKVIALEFLMTTCVHCQECSAILQKLYKEYGPKGFQPVGVAFNDMAALLVPDYIKQLGLTFPVGVAPREEVIPYLQHPATMMLYVPQLMFIDRNFVIRAHYPGGHDFYKNEEANSRSLVEKLLKEPAGSGAAGKKTQGKRSLR